VLGAGCWVLVDDCQLPVACRLTPVAVFIQFILRDFVPFKKHGKVNQLGT
jgi:hypothetical protein